MAELTAGLREVCCCWLWLLWFRLVVLVVVVVFVAAPVAVVFYGRRFGDDHSTQYTCDAGKSCLLRKDAGIVLAKQRQDHHTGISGRLPIQREFHLTCLAGLGPFTTLDQVENDDFWDWSPQN